MQVAELHCCREHTSLQFACCMLESGSLGPDETPQCLIVVALCWVHDEHMRLTRAGLQALGRALMPATELETGTKLRLEDLAAACRQAHSEIVAVVEDVEESEPGDSPDEDSDVEPVCLPQSMCSSTCRHPKKRRRTFMYDRYQIIAHFLALSK